MAARSLTLILTVLLASFLSHLLLGPRSLSKLSDLRTRLSALKQTNNEAALYNTQLQAEVNDLASGLQTIEEHARSDLGMIAPGELYFQYTD